MRTSGTLAAGLLATLCVSLPQAAAAAVPEPTINGVVVQDVTQSFVFDRIGRQAGGPTFDDDFYRGTVQAKVIHAPDDTYDFYFHITLSSGEIRDFDSVWQTPASYTVAHHATAHPVRFPGGDASEPANAGPAPGTFFSNALGVSAIWLTPFQGGPGAAGALTEGILLLDTDARAYAANATYQLVDVGDFFSVSWRGESEVFNTFGPAIPEPETYALMLAGIGLLAFARARRRKSVR